MSYFSGMSQLPKQYDHKISEPLWQKKWQETGVYNFRNDKAKTETFVIDTPPPTVSGVLHMGHVFSYTQADFIARYKRMRGFDVFYPMGFDDNGLPTERLVEKIENVRGSSMKREEFVALCRKVVTNAEEEFRQLFTSIALSVDWNQLYQTVSDRVIALSQASFLDLVAKNECYRDFRPGYWDWVDQTAIATAEIENKEMQGVMVEIKFALEQDKNTKEEAAKETSKETSKEITIATTRPELLAACVAVMYHPEDKNAGKYKNAYAITPLFGARVPLIADEAVDKEFGTGLVMCCTFGDDTDKEWWRKYNLPMRAILGKDGKIDLAEYSSLPVAAEIQGLKPKQAREKSINLLQAAGALISRKDIVHNVKCAERSGNPIEIIPTSQWFIRIIDKKEALKAKGDAVSWHPPHMKIRLDQWIEGLREDWCISRQRFFGVPFPVWYSKRSGEEGKALYAEFSQLPVDPLRDLPKGYLADEVTADIDVMDTWATSSITPQINSCKADAEKFPVADGKLFPADLRPQAHEIIRSWAFYTITKAHLHSNSVPWKNIMISGWCLAADKSKMSKSKGNVVTPVALIQDSGADAVRYWTSTSRLATDTAFSEELLKIGRKLVGKLWNASNFIMQVINQSANSGKTYAEMLKDIDSAPITNTLDKWILSRLNRTISKASAAFDKFEYCDARMEIEDFFWNDFCDNYLELVKARAYSSEGGNKQAQYSALSSLLKCLDAVLRLFAPFVVHVTEEIYTKVFPDNGSVHARGKWPDAGRYVYDEAAEAVSIAAVDILEIIRKAKSEAGVSIKAPVARVRIFVTAKANIAFAELSGVMDDLKAAGSVHEIVESEVSGLQYISRNGAFEVSVELAKIETIKRNSAHNAEEILEGNILSAPGNPDLSKHVVKMQINDLATSLERTKS